MNDFTASTAPVADINAGSINKDLNTRARTDSGLCFIMDHRMRLRSGKISSFMAG